MVCCSFVIVCAFRVCGVRPVQNDVIMHERCFKYVLIGYEGVYTFCKVSTLFFIFYHANIKFRNTVIEILRDKVNS